MAGWLLFSAVILFPVAVRLTVALFEAIGRRSNVKRQKRV